MGFFSSAYYFFTPYTDARERAVGRFFKGLDERSNRSRTRTGLLHLLQRDIAAINLWTEYRYKGYRYLTKTERKRLYANLQLIAEDFERFYYSHAEPAEVVLARIHAQAQQAALDPHKAVLLQAIMDYFSPQRGLYDYHDSSSFGRLLRDPSREKLIGDCNQIVTLYIHLFSRYYDVRELNVHVLPGHVALHYEGIDIEATSGTFANYESHAGSALLPIEEIVSINLLDTTDAYLSRHEVAAEDLLQASRFAFILSHNRDIVSSNLEAAYARAVDSLMKRNNYVKALDFAVASHNPRLLSIVGQNGAIYEMEHHNYGSARRFAQHAPKQDELIRNLWQAEGAHHYQAHRYHDAIKAFKHAGDDNLVQQCYVALFFDEQDTLGSNLTTESLKNHAGTINRMRTYARKSGNKKLIEHADNLYKHL